MIRNKKTIGLFCVLILLGVQFVGTKKGESFTLGKTYDQSNWQEIKDMLPPSILEWVKKGDFILQTKQLEYDFAFSDAYYELSKKNDGKYDIDEQGVFVVKGTREPVPYFEGIPFPTIDPKDPKAAAKIMENQHSLWYRDSATYDNAPFVWVGRGGKERQIVTAGDYFYYYNRRQGPVPNPKNLLYMSIFFVMEPFDLKGVVQMVWFFNDEREAMNLSYIPMMRRIRRVSGAARSDPFVGSDECLDDDWGGWAGKNQTMKWKLNGEQTIIAPFYTEKFRKVTLYPDGSYLRAPAMVKNGYDIPGWKGAPWQPATFVWFPKDVYLVEGFPKDPYYNYGRQIFYVDKAVFEPYIKIAYNRAGEYWKTVLGGCSAQKMGENDVIVFQESNCVVDDKADHATIANSCEYPGHPRYRNLPVDKLSPDYFTESHMRQISK